MRKQKTYTKEFKLNACRRVTEGGLKQPAVAEKLGINATMLFRWVEEYCAQGDGAFVDKGDPGPLTRSYGGFGMKMNGCGRRMRS